IGSSLTMTVTSPYTTLFRSVDVNSNQDNPIIGIRSFGADVATVSEFGSAYLAGLEAAGVAAVAKHFPGHGDTDTDSHLELPTVEDRKSTRLNSSHVKISYAV